MPEIMPWHKTKLIDPTYTRVDLVKEGANSQAHIKLFKSKGGQEDMKLEEILAKMKPEHSAIVKEAIDTANEEATKAKNDLEEMKDTVEKNKKPEAGTSPEEILKSVKDPAVRALLEQNIAKTAAAESVAKALKEEQDTAEAIAKAKEVPNIGAEEAKMADIYKKIKGHDSELATEVFGIMKAASALIAEGGVMTEIGKAAGSADNTLGSEGDAWSKIETMASEIAKSSNVSQATAITQVIKENSGLYNDYIKAQQG
jgi:hypothetical protein